MEIYQYPSRKGKRSEMYICVKESVRRRPETEDRMII